MDQLALNEWVRIASSISGISPRPDQCFGTRNILEGDNKSRKCVCSVDKETAVGTPRLRSPTGRRWQTFQPSVLIERPPKAHL